MDKKVKRIKVIFDISEVKDDGLLNGLKLAGRILNSMIEEQEALKNGRKGDANRTKDSVNGLPIEQSQST